MVGRVSIMARHFTSRVARRGGPEVQPRTTIQYSVAFTRSGSALS